MMMAMMMIDHNGHSLWGRDANTGPWKVSMLITMITMMSLMMTNLMILQGGGWVGDRLGELLCRGECF